MSTGAGFIQFKLGPAGDDHLPVLNVDLEGALKRKNPRFVFHQSQHVEAESGLERGELVKLVQYLAGLGTALEFDDNAHSTPVGFIPQV